MERPRLLLATTNTHKTAELRRLLTGTPHRLVTPAELGLRLTVEEEGATFQENATLKAQAFAEAGGLLALADDSGIEVAAMDGRPGVHSARYGGPGLSDEERMHLLLAELQEVPWEGRECRYVAVIAIADPTGGGVEVFEGTCDGVVALEPAGSGGFGYDPIFHLPQRGLTVAQLPPEEKDAMSHRGQAARTAAAWLMMHSAALAG